jgi:hypothetical protein
VPLPPYQNTYVRVYETKNTDPESNSAVGDTNSNVQALGTLLHGKMLRKFQVISGVGGIPRIDFFLSDGSTLQIFFPGVGESPPGAPVRIDFLKKI